jgi:hypothetical protein
MHDLYSSPSDAITEDEMLGHRSCMGEMRDTQKILVRKPEGRSLGTSRFKWEGRIILN